MGEEQNIRWVITYDTGNGYRAMACAAQGRNTFDTHEAAAQMLSAMLVNNSDDRLSSVFGLQGAKTLRVQPVECWPGHNDPKRTIFECFKGG